MADNGVITPFSSGIFEQILIHDKNTGVLNYYMFYESTILHDQEDEYIEHYEITNIDYLDTNDPGDAELSPFTSVIAWISIIFIISRSS